MKAAALAYRVPELHVCQPLAIFRAIQPTINEALPETSYATSLVIRARSKIPTITAIHQMRSSPAVSGSVGFTYVSHSQQRRDDHPKVTNVPTTTEMN
jgi:hypothetical protein